MDGIYAVTPLCFGRYRLSGAYGPLYRDDEELALRRKPLAVLWHLVSRPDEVVSKEALLKAVWPRKVISDGGLTVCIREIREVLDDDSRRPRFIQTVHGHGYRFIGRSDPFRSDCVSTAAELVVGRTRELLQLDSLYDLASNGRRQLAFVVGEAGIGKTTLIDAWESRLGANRRLGRGQCSDRAGEAYLPILDALSQLCRGASGANVVAALHQYAPSWLLQLPAQLNDVERAELQLQLRDANAERMQRELADVLEVLSAERPLVLVLEDMHWSDSSTVEALTILARRPQSARLLVIASYRPVEVVIREHSIKSVKQELQLHEQCFEIALGYLDEAAVSAYLAERFSFPAAPTAATEIYQRTEGHPLYMVALADYLEANGGLTGNFDCNQAPLSTQVPTGLQQFIELQTERLSEIELRVLEAASVAGRTFATAAVTAALGMRAEAVEQICEALSKRGLFIADSGLALWPDGTLSGNYTFRHALYPDVLYGLIGSARRARLHRLIGECLEQGFCDQNHTIATTLAQHFEQGRQPNRALKYLQLAVEIAGSRFANREVAQLLRRALAQLATLPASAERARRELELQLALGPALISLEGYAAPEVKRHL